MSEGDFCLLISFSGRGDRVGPWDGGGHAWEMVCGITLGPTGMAKEGEKEVVFFAHLHRGLRNAGTGNAQRISAVYWTPNWRIWKVALGVLER